MILKWAMREIFRGWRLSFFFIFNMTLGLTGFISIEALKSSLDTFLADNAKQILSADIAISARRNITEQELAVVRQVIGSDSEESHIFEFFAMLGSHEKGFASARLVEVKAIDARFPFYGSLQLETGGIVSRETARETTSNSIIGQSQIWIYPELRLALGLQKNSSVTLGKLKLTVADIITNDTTQTFRGASIAPKVYVDRALLKDSGLLQFGSTFSESFLFRIPEGRNLEKLKSLLLDALKDPAIQINTAQSAGEDSGRQLKYLSDFLGLVSLVAIFLSSLGIAYLFQLFLSQKLKEIAIFRCLGLTPQKTLYLFTLQAGLLGIFSVIPSLAISQAFIPLLVGVIRQITPFAIQPQLTGISIVFSSMISVGLSLLICLPFISQIRFLHPAQLLREDSGSFDLPKTRWWLFFPGVLVFWILSIAQSNSIRTGSLFILSLVAVIALLGLLGWLGLWLLGRLKPLKDWRINYSLKSLTRKKTTSLAIFITLGMGTLLLNLLPQLKASLNQNLTVNPSSPVPSLFFFDIQEEQTDPLNKTLAQEGLSLKTLSPMIRARILKINDQDYERKLESTTYRTREEEREARQRNRGVNLSYRELLSETESIVEGRPLNPQDVSSSSGVADLSIEYRFAERMGLKLGDRILFDIQGVEVAGEIVNLRRVKWTSFQPNFFILFQNGFLTDAPKTFIGVLPPLREELKQKVIAKVVQEFGNISVIDLSRLIQSLLALAGQMSWSLELMSALTFLAGYIVLYSIVRSQVQVRRWELNMLKVLGADGPSLRIYLLNEFVILSFAASTLGVAMSFAVSAGMMKLIFDSPIAFSYTWAAGTVLLVPLLASGISFWASRSVLQETPAVLLRE